MWDSLQDNWLSLLKKSVSKKNAGGGEGGSSQSKETKEAYKTNKQKS